MKISINWLKEYINLSETPAEIADLLTQSGLEIAHMTSSSPTKTDLSKLLIGQVVACSKHPNADRLHCTQVAIGNTKHLSIVCGAPNVALGQKVVVAPIGTTLHTYQGDSFEIKAAKIRGEFSEGMLCAEDEIGLGPQHEQILVLDTSLAPGTPLSEYIQHTSDTILTVELTPNRIDACSHLGVARDLKALLNRPIQYPTLLPHHAFQLQHALPIKVKVDHPTACPRYTGVVIKGVQVQDSPQWLQDKLQSIGVQPINNIVDIMHLVMYEIGQPMHGFDYDKLAKQEIHVRLAHKGEKLVTLDHIERVLTGEELVIADQEKSIALAGILGDVSTSIQPTTQNIWLESAYFSPQIIRRAAKWHKIQTEASFRYERGTDPHLPFTALRRACLLIQEITGGTLASDLIDFYATPIQSVAIEVSYENIHQLIGDELPMATIHQILLNLDMDIINTTTTGFTAIVPPYRVDVTQEVDLVEEILRIYGYNQLQPATQLGSTFIAPQDLPPTYQIERMLCPILTANGYQEICTNSLSNAHFLPNQHQDTIHLLNPLSDRLNVLRNQLVFSGLEVLAYNIKRKLTDLKLFEFGKTYHKTNARPIEQNKLGIWLTGNIESPHWAHPPRAVSFQDLNTVIHQLLTRLGITTTHPITFSDEVYQQGIKLLYQGKTLATLGQLQASHLQLASIQQPVFFAEINLHDVGTPWVIPTHYQPISKFPLVVRDLSLVLDEHILLVDIKNVLSKQPHSLIQDMHVFDVYQGEKLPKGKKAYALSFYLQATDKTLDEPTIHRTMKDIIHAFQQDLEDKLLQLKANYLQQKDLIVQLQQENRELKSAIEFHRSQPTLTEDKKGKINANLQKMSPANREDFKGLIAHYIAQISACIHLLEKIK
eukprot:gene154-207_t